MPMQRKNIKKNVIERSLQLHACDRDVDRKKIVVSELRIKACQKNMKYRRAGVRYESLYYENGSRLLVYMR